MKSYLKKLTVVIPSYNRPENLKKALHFWSDVDGVKVLVLDGSSQSLEKETVRKLNRRIKYIHLKGVSHARRIFLSKKFIKTKYIVMQCDDEIYYPGGLVKCIWELEKNQTLSCCMGDKVIGYRYRGANMVFFDMYKQFKVNLKFKSKNNINRVSEYFHYGYYGIGRPCMYSVIRSSYYRKVSLFCKDMDKYNCPEIIEIIFDVVLSYYGKIKIIKSFYWLRNKINDFHNRGQNFRGFWNSKKNKSKKNKFLRDVVLIFGNNKLKKNTKDMEKLFDYVANHESRLEAIRTTYQNKSINLLKYLFPKKIIAFLQRYNLNEQLYNEKINTLSKMGYPINRYMFKKVYDSIKLT